MDKPRDRSDGDYVSGADAAALLGVKLQTLYAYVSRGFIRSLPVSGSSRRLYRRSDVEKLRARSEARSGHGPVAASAMHWGEPIISTSITEITSEGPRYRNRLAVELARGGLPFENVAELLWTGRYLEEPIVWEREPLSKETIRLTRFLDRFGRPKPISQVVSMLILCIGMTRGSPSEKIRSSSAVIAARQLVQASAGCFGYFGPRGVYMSARADEPVAASILRACGLPRSKERLRATNAMMVLLADHELSPATFAARIAASSGADLQSCLISAIETGSGSEVAQLFDRVGEFLAGNPGRPELLRRLHDLRSRGRLPAGFNHPLYPIGDPRTAFVLDLARSLPRPAQRFDALYEFLEEAERKFGLRPRMEIGIHVLSAALGFPREAFAGLYALSRMAGWVAHVLEQRLSGTLLRPRAQFVGRTVQLDENGLTDRRV